MRLSVLNATGQFVPCANPIFLQTQEVDLRPGVQLDFEVMVDDAPSLEAHLNKPCQYRLDEGPAFQGELTSLRRGKSTHEALAQYRAYTAFRGMIKVIRGI
jgi:hypothetical protein